MTTHTMQTQKDGPYQPDTFIIKWMIVTHILAFAALFFFSWTNFFVMFGFYMLTTIAITLGYHRLLAHRSFKTYRFVERIAATLGVLALQGGPLEWIAHHRMHHSHTDTPRDPHNAREGFWFSHINWLFRIVPAFDDEKIQRRYGRDIVADPYMMWLQKPSSQIGIQVALGAVLMAIGGVGMVLWGVFLRLILAYHATWLINSACHKFGYRNHDVEDLSTNCWWAAILTSGEGWHNNHHAYPNIAPSGHKWWEFDLTYYIICVMGFFGLAWDIKTLEVDATDAEPAESFAMDQIPTI